jgi:hypothetical protein
MRCIGKLKALQSWNTHIPIPNPIFYTAADLLDLFKDTTTMIDLE